MSGKKPQRAWQRMLSGRRLDLLDPTPMDIEVEDIAHGLAFVARWNGQTEGDFAYSVAEHSLLVETLFRRIDPDVDAKWCLAALLHDAPEYVIGDMISPVKAAVGPGYSALDDRLATAIHIRFGLPATIPVVIKRKIKKADKISAWLEATQIAGFEKSEADKFFGHPDPSLTRGLSIVLRPLLMSVTPTSPDTPNSWMGSMIKVVTAGALHTNEMADLLNEIIVAGGTTALAETVRGKDLQAWMARAPDRSAWHVAEDTSGQIVGFQWIEPAEYLPSDAAEIATFAKRGKSGLGIGSKLFAKTETAARHLGYAWINANIRSDNEGGLAYYQSRGFETYGRKSGVQLQNGLVVDKILKRYDL